MVRRIVTFPLSVHRRHQERVTGRDVGFVPRRNAYPFCFVSLLSRFALSLVYLSLFFRLFVSVLLKTCWYESAGARGPCASPARWTFRVVRNVSGASCNQQGGRTEWCGGTTTRNKIVRNSTDEVEDDTTDNACDCFDSRDYLNETYYRCDATSGLECQLVLRSGWHGM